MIIKKYSDFRSWIQQVQGDSDLIYNNNAEDGVSDQENIAKEELICDIKIEEEEFIEQQSLKAPLYQFII